MIDTPLFLTPGSAGSFSGEDGLFILLPQLCPHLSLSTSWPASPSPLSLGKRTLSFQGLGRETRGQMPETGQELWAPSSHQTIGSFPLTSPKPFGSTSLSLTPALPGAPGRTEVSFFNGIGPNHSPIAVAA